MFQIGNIIIVINLRIFAATIYQSGNGIAIAGRQRGAYRFLTATIPLKAFLGTAWIWFSLRSLKDRKTEEGEDVGPEESHKTHT